MGASRKSVRFAAVLLLAVAGDAAAFCGFGACPAMREAPSARLQSGRKGRLEVVREGLRVEASFRQAEFDWRGVTGHYARHALRSEWRSGAVAVGAEVPTVLLTARGRQTLGQGEGLFFGEGVVSTEDKREISVGAELVVPGSARDDGIAASRPGALPYFSIREGDEDRLHYVSAGVRFQSDDGRAVSHPLFVSPRSEIELVYRAGLLRPAGEGARPELYVEGQHALKGADSGTGYLAAGLAVGAQIKENWEFRPAAEIPLVRPERFKWKAGAVIRGRF